MSKIRQTQFNYATSLTTKIDSSSSCWINDDEQEEILSMNNKDERPVARKIYKRERERDQSKASERVMRIYLYGDNQN